MRSRYRSLTILRLQYFAGLFSVERDLGSGTGGVSAGDVAGKLNDFITFPVIKKG
ncbi:MAG: hypothetical protein IPP36_03630 [Nitrosomonadales bacterium]|nr:hypothetical protein [Nitrosomonadales bacterium]